VLAQDDTDEALKLFRRCLAVAETGHADQQWLGTYQNAMAVALARIGDLDGAQPYYELAIANWRQALGDAHPYVAGGVNNLGNLFDSKGQYLKSKALLEEAVGLTRAAHGPRHRDVAAGLANLADVLQQLGDYDEAAALYDEALTVYREVVGPEHPHVALTLHHIAGLLREQGRFADAKALFEESIALSSAALGDGHSLVVASRNGLAMTLANQGEHAAAQALYEGTLEDYERIYGPTHPLVAVALLNLATARQARADLDGARALVERSLEIRRATLGDDHPDIAENVHTLGMLASDGVDFGAAERYFRQSMEIRQRALGADHPDVADSLDAVAQVVESSGDLRRARQLYEACADIRRERRGPNHPVMADSYMDLAGIAKAQGDYPSALSLFEQGLAVVRTSVGEAHPTNGRLLNNLASLHSILGDRERALDGYAKSLEVTRAAFGPDHPRVADAEINYASELAVAGQFEEANRRMEEGVDIRQRNFGPDHPTVGSALHNLGVLRMDQERLYEAQTLVERGLAIREASLGDRHPLVATSLRTLSKVAALQGRMEASRALSTAALSIHTERLALLDGLSEREALAYVASIRRDFDRWLDLHDRPADARQAYEMVLAWKAVATRTLMDRARNRGSIEEGEASELVQTRRELSRLTFDIDGTRNADRAERIAELTAQKERLERALAGPGSRQWGVTDLSLAAICDSLGPDSVLVDVIRYIQEGDALYAAFVTRPTGCTVDRIELGSADALDEAVARWREAMVPDALTWRIDARGERVSRLLWSRLAVVVGDAEVVWMAPDGALSLVPWAALPTVSGQYLIERHEFRLLALASDLVERPPQATATGLLAVGGVDYAPGVGDPSEVRAGLCRDTPFETLPGTVVEVERLTKRWRRRKREPVSVLSGAAAREDAVVQAMEQAGYLHFATHGFFASAACRSALSAGAEGVGHNPLLLSGLALAGANQPTPINDAILTAEEVATLDLRNTSQVVLSACETGLGEVHSGEGVLGLQRAFAYSGVPTVVMSLWSVPDKETVELMDRFYAGILRRKPLLAPTALRVAQLALLDRLRASGAARPQDWAPWVVSGTYGAGASLGEPRPSAVGRPPPDAAPTARP